MKQVKPTIQPVSLMEDFGMFFKKYSSFNLADEYNERQEAEEDIQQQYATEVEELVNDYSEYLNVEYDEDEEGNVYTTVDHDDFREKFVYALLEEFRLEKK